MRAAPSILLIALAAATAGCASGGPAPPAPDLVAIRIGNASPPARAPSLPPDVPADAAIVALGGAAGGARFFAVTRVFEGRHIDYLGVGVITGADGSFDLRPDGDWRLFGRGDPVFRAPFHTDYGWTYSIGVRSDGGHHRAYVARFPEGAAGSRERWEFLAADGAYSTSIRAAAPLFEAGPGGVAIVPHPVDATPVAISLRASPDGGCDLLARAGAWTRPLFRVWGPQTRLAHLPDVAPPGRVAFDRAPRAVAGAPHVVEIPGAGRFRIAPSGERP